MRGFNALYASARAASALAPPSAAFLPCKLFAGVADASTDKVRLVAGSGILTLSAVSAAGLEIVARFADAAKICWVEKERFVAPVVGDVVRDS